MKDKEIGELVKRVASRFPSFGGGQTDEWNPIAQWTREQPVQFAAGVDIEQVVRFVLAHGSQRVGK